jgi:hypothetical protein
VLPSIMMWPVVFEPPGSAAGDTRMGNGHWKFSRVQPYPSSMAFMFESTSCGFFA